MENRLLVRPEHIAKEILMDQEERWAMVDACRSEIEEHIGYTLTNAEWDEVVDNIYDDAKESFFDIIEEMLDGMRCENEPAA